jgi:mono/diheme cytochrome c family protein
MRTLLKVVAWLALVLVVLTAGVYLWATFKTRSVMSETLTAHTVTFPIPFPLEATEPGYDTMSQDDRDALARERARARGEHLVNARYVCVECHGANFGGGTMVDAFPLGQFLGPNLTTGEGSKTVGYTPADWDRIVRHGIRRDGRPAIMPSVDFVEMSDQELSDIIVYIQSRPAVDNVVPESTFGPLGKILVATGQLTPEGLHRPPDPVHAALPPPTAATVEFGRHIASVCTGCHGTTFEGGPIPGGDPSWPPSRNLTPHADALGPWSYEQFATALREGRRPDGTALLAPMSLLIPYGNRMTDVEMQALWMFLRSLPPVQPAN